MNPHWADRLHEAVWLCGRREVQTYSKLPALLGVTKASAD